MNNLKYKYSVYIFLSFIIILPLAIHLSYISNYLLEGHAYRQTQTALVSYWMIKDGFRLNYLMPVIGYPWSAPLEFPIFQWLVSYLVYLTNWNLEKTGRSLSIFFYYISLIPLICIVRKYGLVAIILATVIYLSSPVELFYSRSFLIENCAVFLSISAFYIYLCKLKNNEIITIFLYLAIGSLAGLQKITTYLPVALICMFDILSQLRVYKKFKFNKLLALKFFLVLLTLIPAILWSKYSDIVKDSGYISRFLLSTVQNDWIFGNLSTRLNFLYWEKVFGYRLIILGGLIIPLCITIYLYFKKKLRVSRESILLILIGIAGPLIFGPLFYVHDYYLLASIIFLVGGFSILLADSLNGHNFYRLKYIVFILIIIFNYGIFYNKYYKKIINFSEIDIESVVISKYLSVNMRGDDVVVIMGLDWNSTIPFYSEHYALMLPAWLPSHSEVISFPEKFTGGRRIGAIVICNNELWPINIDKSDFNNLINKVNGVTKNFSSCIVKINNK